MTNNLLGLQTSRTIKGQGGSAPRTMTSDYYLDGKLKARSDTSSPKGSDVIVVDNTDPDDLTNAGSWASSTKRQLSHYQQNVIY